MRSTRKFLLGLSLVVPGAVCANAQNVVSAKAGLVHIVEGEVFLNDQQLHPKVTEFPDIKDNQVLRTEIGRTEVLLAPGTFLRMGENSSFKMLSNKLADTRLEVLAGEVLIEVAEYVKENSLAVSVPNSVVTPRKAGVYRFEPSGVRVYEGEAVASSGEQTWNLKSGRSLLAANGSWTTEKFDSDVGDSLYRWSKRRSSYIAMANVSAAAGGRSYGGRGFGTGYGLGYGSWGYSPIGYSTGCGSWAFNPYFGMMTLIPCRGMITSPFGWRYFTPGTVYMAFWPQQGMGGYGGGGGAINPRSPVFDSNVGYSTYSGRSYGGGYSGGGSMGGGSVSAPAAAPSGGGSMRGGADGGARGGAGGGRGQ